MVQGLLLGKFTLMKYYENVFPLPFQPISLEIITRSCIDKFELPDFVREHFSYIELRKIGCISCS